MTRMSPTWRAPSRRIVALLLLPAAPAVAQFPAATHLVAQRTVTIDRSAMAVWPHIVEPSAWKQGNRLVHVAGPWGAEGETFAALPAAGGAPDFYLVNAELVPYRRRTMKLVGTDGTLDGFATYSLEERDGRTTVRYDVVAETRIPDGASPGAVDSARARAAAGQREAVQRFDAELAALKRLVEAAPPERTGYATTPDGVRLWYREVGRGPDVVLVNAANYFAASLDGLASDTRRVVTFDIRGRGRTDSVPPDKMGILEFDAVDPDVIRQAVGAERVAIVGWSGGALSAFRYAERFPARVTRVALLTPVGPRFSPWWDAMRRNAAPRADTALARRLAARAAAGEWEGDEGGRCRAEAWLGLRTNWPDSTQWHRAPDVCDSPNEVPSRYMDFVPRLLARLGAFDFREGLPRFPLPLLVVHGERDNPPLAGSREWVAGVPQGRLLVMPGMGHWPQYERPAETIAALRAFLDGGWPAGAEPVAKVPAGRTPPRGGR